MSVRAALIVALLGSIGWSMPAFAQCGGSQLCAPGAGDCVVSANCTITIPDAGLTIDLGSRKLVVLKTLTIAGPAGASLTINAGSFLLDGSNGGTIIAPGADMVAGNVTINLLGDATVQGNGLIDVSAGIAPGSVDIEALGGSMSFAGRIKANGTTRAADGGDITLYGLTNLTASGTMDASAGDMGLGGSITLLADTGFLTVTNVLNAAGGDGGELDVEAGTTLTVAGSATMMVNANGDAGSGGDIELDSGDDMVVNADSDGTGSPAASSQDMQSGGDGADVSMTSFNGSLQLNGRIDASGAAGGTGGNIDLEANVNLTYTKQLFAMSTGSFGFGGDVSLFAGGDLNMPQQVNTNGGTGSGGTMEATAGGTLTVSAPVITDGTVEGGATLLYGCNVNITPTGILSALGPGGLFSGTNTVQASTSMTINGILKAGVENLLMYRQAPPPTIGPKAIIQPAATLQLTPSLPCCVNCPVTTTTTTTVTTSTSTTFSLPTTTQTTTTGLGTTTTTLAGVCGDHVVNGNEQCDGGDCCSPTCTFQASGSPCTSDNNVCTSDVCNATGTCTHPAGNAGTVCRPANGDCDAAESCTGNSPDCPPDVAATAGTPCRPSAGECDVAESCDGTSKACPADAKRTDECRPANGACDVAENCDGVSDACPPDVKKEDGTNCAPDACTTGAVCTGGTCSSGTQVTCPSCETCDPDNGECVVQPRPSCTLPVKSGKSAFQMKLSSKGPKNNQVVFKWVTGGATTTGEFGDPLTSDGVTLCVYDRSQATPSLLFSANIAAGGTCDTKPCWKKNKTKGFSFASKTGDTTGGVVNLKLVSGEAGKAKVQAKGKGTALSGRPFGMPQLPLDVPLTVQVQSETGACWEANFSQAGVDKNDDQQFSGKAD